MFIPIMLFARTRYVARWFNALLLSILCLVVGCATQVNNFGYRVSGGDVFWGQSAMPYYVDASTFRLIPNGNGRYGADAKFVYFGGRAIYVVDPISHEIIAQADPKTFRVLSGGEGNYGIDSRYVIYRDTVIHTIDPLTKTVTNWADPKSFVIVDKIVSHDNRTIYNQGREVRWPGKTSPPPCDFSTLRKLKWSWYADSR